MITNAFLFGSSLFNRKHLVVDCIILISEKAICKSSNNYIFYSLSYTGDNNNYIDESGNDNKLHCGILSSYFSYTFNDKYYLSFDYKYNKESANDYMMPLRGSYGYISFSYHLKERNKFPLNISFGITSGESIKDGYKANSFEVQVYKKFDANFYPFSISYLISKNNSSFNNLNISKDYSHILSRIGFQFILDVDMNNNTAISDMILLGFNISKIKNDLFGSINIGISHPIQ